jgi:hypothetical protein
MASKMDLYNHDFYAWTQQQAALLRESKVHDLDCTNLAEEIESLGRSDKRELGNRLHILVMHLLKWRYQPEGHVDSHSWEDTVWHQRTQLTCYSKRVPAYGGSCRRGWRGTIPWPGGTQRGKPASRWRRSPIPAPGPSSRSWMRTSGQRAKPGGEEAVSAGRHASAWSCACLMRFLTWNTASAAWAWILWEQIFGSMTYHQGSSSPTDIYEPHDVYPTREACLQEMPAV